MRKILFLLIGIVFLTGCGTSKKLPDRARVGVIGTDTPISREMAAKTIALAFYTKEELAELEKQKRISGDAK